MPRPFFRSFLLYRDGDLAQLARASALQAEGQGFKPPNLHSLGAARVERGRARSLTGRGKGEGLKRKRDLPRVSAGRGSNMAKRRMGPWWMPEEPGGDEGRDKPREAAGRSTYPSIRGCPNGVTRMPQGMHPGAE